MVWLFYETVIFANGSLKPANCTKPYFAKIFALIFVLCKLKVSRVDPYNQATTKQYLENQPIANCPDFRRDFFLNFAPPISEMYYSIAPKTYLCPVKLKGTKVT
jgi:hypothetical protein